MLKDQVDGAAQFKGIGAGCVCQGFKGKAVIDGKLCKFIVPMT
jgi:hypothetical protein